MKYWMNKKTSMVVSGNEPPGDRSAWEEIAILPKQKSLAKVLAGVVMVSVAAAAALIPMFLLVALVKVW